MLLNKLGDPYKVNRFPRTYEGWGFSSSSVDAITFRASKNIRVFGIGMYKFQTDAQGTIKFVRGSEVNDTALINENISTNKLEQTSEDKIVRFKFPRPISVKAEENYTVVLIFTSGRCCYGEEGVVTTTGEKDVIFTFAYCNGSSNGTSVESGLVPEIYYYV
eukprot:TRINITY_DN9564_c0_g1_i1.p1 TRINITY_DN9564_c0_g1~~TRINITY_DN9564_c0_g1_i1.p1  ORF type:complete len:162 (-),score=27.73 TRINITY_DN9564_c0_g1_i1:165-650(-)